jgi:predicted metalloprotease
MASSETERPLGRRAPARLWSVAVTGALMLAAIGAKVSARYIDREQSSAAASAHTPAPTSRTAEPTDEKLNTFVLSVAKDVDALWARDFRRRNKPYRSAEPVLLDSPSKSDCGPGVALGRSDCFGSDKAFIDLSFQRALEERYGEEGAGARAYVIAHELGHHVQRVLGLDQKIESLLTDRKVASHWVEVQLELQADCLAGVWTRRTTQPHLGEPTQIEASIRRTSELGTERRLTEKSDAESVGESFTYAIPRRRIYWFAQGYSHGEIDDCDTFAP